MKGNWPMWTVAAFGAAAAVDGLIILLSSGPLACNGSEHGSNLAAVFALIGLVMFIGGPSTLIAVGLREALIRRPVPVYSVITIGVPVILGLSGWAIGSAGSAASCGSSFM
jgi:hypothetical protein